MALTNNKNVLKWVDEMVALTKPDKVVWIDGSDEQLNALRDEAVASGEMIRLNQEKLPGCLYHRTQPNDVARVEDRTFICSKTKENAGPTNNWCDPAEMYAARALRVVLLEKSPGALVRADFKTGGLEQSGS